MSAITLLDKDSARKISAGQVITDLVSVLKELLENSLDAGAHAVTLRLSRFGLDKIVVEDDGCGIPMPRLIDTETGALIEGASTPLLASRATTKLSATAIDDAQAEEAAGTPDGTTSPASSLGFRGEALHSLAHMSDVTLETMSSHTAPYTARIIYDRAQDASCISVCRTRQAVGTTVLVENLFQHFPVRLKDFTKNARKQLLRAVASVKQYSVSHPRLRLIMTHQESPSSAQVTLISFTGSNDLKRSVTEAYGGMCVSRMSAVTWACASGTITGFVSNVAGGGRLSSDHQVLALDGRLVDLPRVARAINEAFTQCLPNASQRLSVAFFLQMTTNETAGYDVNLTPNKRKVLLVHEEHLTDEVYRLALKEFTTSTESIEVQRQASMSQHQRVEGQRTAVAAAAATARSTLVPVSATSFTEYSFKLAEQSQRRSEVRKEGPALDPGKLGVALYGDEEYADTSDGAGGVAVRCPSLDSSFEEELENTCANGGGSEEQGGSDSDDNVNSEHTAEEPSGSISEAHTSENERWKRRRMELTDQHGGVMCDCGSASQSGEVGGEEEEDVLVLSDQGNQRRGDGMHTVHAFPPLHLLADEELVLTTALLIASAAGPAGRGGGKKGFSSLTSQTEAELNTFFRKESFREMTVFGQFNHGFIIAALGDDVFVVDQHAADEKYNYERLMSSYVAKPQPLVVPVPVVMDASEVDLAVDHAADLLQHGFKCQRGSDPTKLLVSALPVLQYDVVSATDIVELIEQLVRYGSIVRPLRAVWHSMATKACRSSIMIGTALPVKTMKSIVSRLEELDQPWNCPHGRPTLRHLCNLSALQKMMPHMATR